MRSGCCPKVQILVEMFLAHLSHCIVFLLVSTESSGDGNSESVPPHTFSLTPTIDFTSQPTTDPHNVFRQPAKTLTSSEGKQLTDSLLESIVKCMQIQNSLYRLVLLKLNQHVTDAVCGSIKPVWSTLRSSEHLT